MLAASDLSAIPVLEGVQKTRLIIHKIVCENFKSYAGRQEIGPFHKSFTSVVGPNGSGKSNVIDAIMFVLGYRAKKMRQGKLSDLIHLSENMTELESCAVEVHFRQILDKPGDEFEVVGERDLIVARTAYRNNRNIYTINGLQSNYTEVTSLLRGHGVDLDHKRFLILQGEVEAIAMMKPKASTEHEEGLLEYLEDIIGTNKYIDPTEEAAKAMDAIGEQYSEKFIRVKAAERECNALRGEKEGAEAYLKLENNLIERKSELCQAQSWQLKKDVIKSEGKLSQKRKELEEERLKHSENAKLADELEAKVAGATRDMREAEKRVKSLQNDLGALEQRDVKLQEVKRHLKAKFKSTTSQSKDSAKQQKDLERNIEDCNAEIDQLTRDIELKSAEHSEASAELGKISSSLRGVTAKFQKELESKQSELNPLQNQLRDEQQIYDMAKSALSMIEAKSNNGKVEEKQMEERLRSVQAEIDASDSKWKSFSSAKESHQVKLEETAKNISELERRRTDVNKEVAMMQSTYAEASALLGQGEGGSHIHKALMKEAKSGRITGIHGRLGDLGVIDGKFDVAIATACSYLDHIVVERTESGQACIEFLRRNKLGRANFIVMDKMRPAQRDPPRDLPVAAHRLFDLVKVKDLRHLDAMYFALTDTLVAEDIGSAQRWAYGSKRWRVVTIDGKLFETSGTISGGGHARRGGMGSQFKAEIGSEQVNQLRERLEELRLELKNINVALAREQAARADLEEKMERFESEVVLAEAFKKSLLQEAEILHENIRRIKEFCKATANPSKEDQKLTAEKNAIMISCQKQIDQIHTKMAPIESEISRVQQQILDAGGMKYKVQKSKVDSLQGHISAAKEHVISLEKDRVIHHNRLNSLRSSAVDTEAVVKIEAELAEVNASTEEITMQAMNLAKEMQEAASVVEETTGQLELVKNEIGDAVKAVNRFRKIEYELRCVIEGEETKIEEAQRVILQNETELATLKLTPIDPNSNPVLASYEDDEVSLAEFARNSSKLRDVIANLTEKLQSSQPNLAVLAEYRIKEEALRIAEAELEALDVARGDARGKYEDLRRRRLDEFMTGFRAISSKLKEMYQLITMGGNAELELVDSLDPFSEGVLFSVMPPRKSWKLIANLSGGEKTLSSLALVFALHTYRPTPIYIMDEIDAALDFRNVSIVANYIKERTCDAQFIVISLRNNMFELADRLVGIYKTMQRTKSITIDPRQFEHFLPRPSSVAATAEENGIVSAMVEGGTRATLSAALN